VQELYFDRIYESITKVINTTYSDSFSAFRTLILVLFLICLSFLFVTLFILRNRMIVVMRDDIFKSRGILNLIPNSFFEQNKSIVEGIMKKLKY
jgi:hypothetical protein